MKHRKISFFSWSLDAHHASFISPWWVKIIWEISEEVMGIIANENILFDALHKFYTHTESSFKSRLISFNQTHLFLTLELTLILATQLSSPSICDNVSFGLIRIIFNASWGEKAIYLLLLLLLYCALIMRRLNICVS